MSRTLFNIEKREIASPHEAAAEAHRFAAQEAADPSATSGQTDYGAAGMHNVKAER